MHVRGAESVWEKFLYLPLNFVVNLKLLFKNCLIKNKNKNLMKPHYFELYYFGKCNLLICVGMKFTESDCRKVSKPLNSTNTIIRRLTCYFVSGDKYFSFEDS